MGEIVYRRLERTDLDKGYLELLSQLTEVGQPPQQSLERRFDEIDSNADYRILVAEDPSSGRLVGSATVVVERKFIHECGKVGHIEDIIVDENCRGRGVGRRLIEESLIWAKGQGCYKAMLDCAMKNASFYAKCGMTPNETQFVKYF